MSYVGQSTDIKRRWENHKSLNNAKRPDQSQYHHHLYRAIRKYGVEQFHFEVLDECRESELAERELHYINLLDTYENGYNQTLSTVNPFLDPKIQKKAQKTWREKYAKNKEYLKKLGGRTKAHWENTEYRKKVTDANTGNLKIAKSSKKMWKNPKTRAMIIDSIKKRTSTDKFKKKKSAEIKAAWERGCYSAEVSRRNLENYHDKLRNDKEYRAKVIRNMKSNKPNKKAIVMLDKKSKEELMVFDKLMDAAEWVRKNTGYKKADYSTIRKSAKIKGRSAYGYKWKLLGKGGINGN
jgi:group I intron endonuclease